jgi:hypothetical protein
MTRFLFTLFAGLAMTTIASAQMWATATSTNASNGRAIIFRYVKEFAPQFSRGTQPCRVILAWKYDSQNGMPATAEHKRMDAMEDAVDSTLEADNFATLALVSTGEDLREWVYYAKSDDEFMTRLNKALRGKPEFPIEIHAALDPLWITYEEFRAGVEE